MKTHKKYLIWIAAALALLLLLSRMPTSASTSGSAEEKRIAEVLGAMAGAGKVEVALFYGRENASLMGGETATGRPTGAVVVAEGANDLSVRLALTRAVRTLLGLPEAAVDVFVMEEER